MVLKNSKGAVAKTLLLIISVVAIVIALIASLIIWGNKGQIQANKPEEAKIKATITEAVDKTHSICILPKPYNSLPNEKIPTEVRQKKFDEIEKQLAEVYSGRLLNTRIGQMRGGVEGQEIQKFRVIAGGVKKVENVKIDIQGEKAYVEADIWTWVKSLESDGKSINSGSGKHYIFTLIKEEGKWKIIDESFNYLPGQGP